MKKILFAVTLTLASTSLVSKAGAASLILRGEIAANCVLDSVDTAPFSGANLNLPIVAGTSSTSVANANVTCNNSNGYRIEATSANGNSRLVNTTVATSYADYELEITGVGSAGFQALSGTATTLKTTSLSAPVVGQSSAINVRVYPIATPAVAGTYEDTVTITLTAL